jgi:hypothetical protein
MASIEWQKGVEKGITMEMTMHWLIAEDILLSSKKRKVIAARRLGKTNKGREEGRAAQ